METYRPPLVESQATLVIHSGRYEIKTADTDLAPEEGNIFNAHFWHVPLSNQEFFNTKGYSGYYDPYKGDWWKIGD
jgi:hypothetical protein